MRSTSTSHTCRRSASRSSRRASSRAAGSTKANRPSNTRWSSRGSPALADHTAYRRLSTDVTQFIERSFVDTDLADVLDGLDAPVAFVRCALAKAFLEDAGLVGARF